MSEISAQTGEEIPDWEQALLLKDDGETILIETLEVKEENEMLQEDALRLSVGLLEGKLKLADEKMVALQETLTNVENLLAQSMDAHKKDVHTIAIHLVKAAREYEWCSTYDSKVEDINEELHVKLPARTTRYWVTGKITFNFRTEMMMDFDIEEESSEDKEREARNYLMEMGSHELQNAIDNYSREFEEISVRKL